MAEASGTTENPQLLALALAARDAIERLCQALAPICEDCGTKDNIKLFPVGTIGELRPLCENCHESSIARTIAFNEAFDEAKKSIGPTCDDWTFLGSLRGLIFRLPTEGEAIARAAGMAERRMKAISDMKE